MTRCCGCGDTCDPTPGDPRDYDGWWPDDQPDASDIGDMQRDWDRQQRVTPDPWEAA